MRLSARAPTRSAWRTTTPGAPAPSCSAAHPSLWATPGAAAPATSATAPHTAPALSQTPCFGAAWGCAAAGSHARVLARAARAGRCAALGGGAGNAGGGGEVLPRGAAAMARRQQQLLSRRSRGPSASEPAPSATSSPAALPSAGGRASPATGPPGSVAAAAAAPRRSPRSSSAGGGSDGAAGGAGSVATAAAAEAAVALVEEALEGGESDMEGPLDSSSGGEGSNILPFGRQLTQPRALVLDCAYRPINVVTWYKAFHFDYFGKGEVLEYYPPPAVCYTGMGEFPLPAVLRVPQYTADIQDLCSRVACTRRNVMVRDGFCCQYCGARRDLTIDHVQPASKGGKDTWDNLVTACQRCNQKKSNRSLRDLGWRLKRVPKEPTPYEIGILAGVSTSDILRPPPEWELYIGPYRERLENHRRAALEAGLLNLMDAD